MLSIENEAAFKAVRRNNIKYVMYRVQKSISSLHPFNLFLLCLLRIRNNTAANS